MSMTVKATEIARETNDGETFGYYEPTGAEITITGRVRQVRSLVPAVHMERETPEVAQDFVGPVCFGGGCGAS